MEIWEKPIIQTYTGDDLAKIIVAGACTSEMPCGCGAYDPCPTFGLGCPTYTP